MSTYCSIAALDDNGNVLFSTCKFDGYPEGVGAELLKYFNTHDSARSVANMGEIRCIDHGDVEVYKDGYSAEVFPNASTYFSYLREDALEYNYYWNGESWSVDTYGYLDWTELSRIVKIKDSALTKFGNTPTKKTIVNRLYKKIEPLTSKFYSDDFWEPVGEIFDIFESEGGVVDLQSSQYYNMVRGASDPAYKEYMISVEFPVEAVTVGGSITCHAAGTEDDPFSKYDVTCVLW